jgi:hypothetical protein
VLFERLSTPRRGSQADDYESSERVRKDYGINRDSVPKWQSGL